MTIDLKRKGLRVVEVEVDMAHRATGGDLAAQLHLARQFVDVARALAREPRAFLQPPGQSLKVRAQEQGSG
jgi:hypothetical protein